MLEKLDLMTTEEVCYALRLKRDSLLRLVHRGELGAIKITPKCFRFRREEVERFIEDKIRQGEEERKT